MNEKILQLAANVLVLSAMSTSAAIRYVDVNSASPMSPYTNWTTAATGIQDAVDAAMAGDQILVTNGVYQTGERVVDETLTSRVAVTAAIMVRSVNGAAVTVIDGRGTVRCVYMANGAAVVGFRLTEGGVYCASASAVVSNCVLTGGGAAGGTLFNCTISNSSGYFAGGARYATLNNCILSSNSAWGAGGAFRCTLNNCTLTANSGFITGGAAECTLANCIFFHNIHQGICEGGCDSAPGFLFDDHNWSGDPLFVDYAGGNLRLQSNSPCINTGSNASAPAGPDLDGNARIVGRTVDIGAYEFQSPQSLFRAWLQQYSLPTDGSADYTDTDGDGLNNWQEWRAGTNPTNALSVLRLFKPTSAASGVKVGWQSVSNRNYILERATELGAHPLFLRLATNIVGQPGTTTFTDTNAVGVGPFFYRVRVQQ